MDTLTLDRYRQIIESILLEYTKIPYAYGEIETEAVFDRLHDRYLLMNTGWDKEGRVHGCLVHVDLIDGKYWIQRRHRARDRQGTGGRGRVQGTHRTGLQACRNASAYPGCDGRP